MEHFYDDQFRVQYLGGKKKETKKKLKFECQEIMGLFKIEDLAEEPRRYKDAGISLFLEIKIVYFLGLLGPIIFLNRHFLTHLSFQNW